MRNQSMLWCLCVALLLSVGLLTTEAHAIDRGSDGFLKKGAFGGRFGLGLGTQQTISNNGNGEPEVEVDYLVGIPVGASYALNSRIALDLDASFWLLLDGFELDQVSLTPGSRAFLFPRLYGRLAVQNTLLSPSNNMLLTGVGYYSSVGALSFFIEINYVALSRIDVDPPIFPRFGIDASF